MIFKVHPNPNQPLILWNFYSKAAKEKMDHGARGRELSRSWRPRTKPIDLCRKAAGDKGCPH